MKGKQYRVKVSVYSGCMGVKDTIYYVGCNSKKEAYELAQELEEEDNSNWTTCQVQCKRIREDILVSRSVWINI